MKTLGGYAAASRESREKIITSKTAILRHFFECCQALENARLDFEVQVMRQLHEMYHYDPDAITIPSPPRNKPLQDSITSSIKAPMKEGSRINESPLTKRPARVVEDSADLFSVSRDTAIHEDSSSAKIFEEKKVDVKPTNIAKHISSKELLLSRISPREPLAPKPNSSAVTVEDDVQKSTDNSQDYLMVPINNENRIKTVFATGSEKLKKALSSLKATKLTSPLQERIMVDDVKVLEEKIRVEAQDIMTTELVSQIEVAEVAAEVPKGPRTEATPIELIVLEAPVADKKLPEVEIKLDQKDKSTKLQHKAVQIFLEDDLLNSFSPIVPFKGQKQKEHGIVTKGHHSHKKKELLIEAQIVNKSLETEVVKRVERETKAEMTTKLVEIIDLMDEKPPILLQEDLLGGDSIILTQSVKNATVATARSKNIQAPTAQLVNPLNSVRDNIELLIDQPDYPDDNDEVVFSPAAKKTHLKPSGTPVKVPLFIASGNKATYSTQSSAFKLKNLVAPTNKIIKKASVIPATPVTSRPAMPAKKLRIPGTPQNRRVQQLKDAASIVESPLRQQPDISLAAINTEDEYGSSEDDGDNEEARLQKKLKLEERPSWVESPELKRHLERQQIFNPEQVFGSLTESLAAPVDIKEIFLGSATTQQQDAVPLVKSNLAGKAAAAKTAKNTTNTNVTHLTRPRTSSANWSGTDRLTSKEIQNYNKEMGYR